MTANGFLSDGVRDYLLIAAASTGVGLSVAIAVLAIIQARFRHRVEQCIKITEDSLCLVGEYSRLFKETGSDLPAQIETVTNKAADKVIEVVKSEKSARDSGTFVPVPAEKSDEGSFPTVE